MYTQCTHCKAVFRVNMREVTAANGKLRCGECQTIFDATENLSTSPLPAFKEDSAENSHANSLESKGTRQEEETNNSGDEQDGVISVRTNILEENPIKTNNKSKSSVSGKNTKWLLIVAMLLALLFIAQLVYNKGYFFSSAPKHEPDKISMLNHSVFAHPNKAGVLLISASFKNTADHAQPFPILEIRLTDSESKIIALRRFTPDEYLDSYQPGKLLAINKPTDITLTIKDPGKKATRFQFDFL